MIPVPKSWIPKGQRRRCKKCQFLTQYWKKGRQGTFCYWCYAPPPIAEKKPPSQEDIEYIQMLRKHKGLKPNQEKL